MSKRTASRAKIACQLEYLYPKSADRNIQTVLFDITPGIEINFTNRLFLSAFFGLTANYAWGNITQLDNNFKDVVYLNKAFGAGPVLFLSAEPVIYKRVSISADASGGFILYSTHFPAGGDIYNFIWRSGIALHYKLSDCWALSAGLRLWMHVSNGQGLNLHNPSYEARGIYFTVTKYF